MTTKTSSSVCSVNQILMQLPLIRKQTQRFNNLMWYYYHQRKHKRRTSFTMMAIYAKKNQLQHTQQNVAYTYHETLQIRTLLKFARRHGCCVSLLLLVSVTSGDVVMDRSGSSCCTITQTINKLKITTTTVQPSPDYGSNNNNIFHRFHLLVWRWESMSTPHFTKIQPQQNNNKQLPSQRVEWREK